MDMYGNIMAYIYCNSQQDCKYMSNVHNPSWLIISLEYTNVAI